MVKRITLKEVARRAGVSYQTVSKVLNGQAQVAAETELRILEAVEALGYRPDFTARSLRSRRAFTIGYSWASSAAGQANPVLDQFLQSMFQAAERHGYYILSFPFQKDASSQVALYAELLETGRVDGFVLSSVEYQDPRILFLLERGFPFAAFGRSDDALCYPCLDVDGAAGLQMATSHLIEQGHRAVACLAWPESSSSSNHRLAGYRQALQAAGIQSDPAWVIRSDGNRAAGYQAALQLMDLPEERRPTALVAVSDLLAIGAMQAARARGLQIGRDLGITGFDDSPLVQYLSPSLTSVRQPVWEAGQQVIQLLLDRINGGPASRPPVLLQPELIVRESSQPSR